MKKLILSFIGIIVYITIIAQAPNAFKYQAIARNSSGELITSQKVSFQISILQGSATGSSVYTETHVDTTNAYGLVTLEIGNGNSFDNFSAIEWVNGPYFIQIGMDINGNTNYELMGTSQLLSVPFSLNSNTALKADTSTTFNKLTNKGNEECNAENEGIMRYNASDKQVEYCNGIKWIVLGEKTSMPSLQTNSISNITTNSSYSGGIITDNGDGSIIEKGLCWDTVTNPTINNNKTLQGSGSDAFTSNITGLITNDVYYVRAYGTNTAGTGYGNEQTFTTLASLITSPANNNTLTGFKCGGDITVGGKAAIINRGIVYSTSSNPDINDNKTSDGTGTGIYASVITGLSDNTKYYYRAYGENAGGINYGDEKNTSTLANITTSDYISANKNSITVGGIIDIGGGENITARGIAYSINSNPDTSNSITICGEGTGTFTDTIEGLQSNTKYHYRAYSTNTGGIGFGTDKTATTKANVSSTLKGPAASISTSFVTGGVIDTGGAATITERGIVYGVNPNPAKTDNYKQASSGGVGLFHITLDGLSNSIYYRAYAENSSGISYGPEYKFTLVKAGSGVTDYDGNNYNTLIIEEQEWMNENLRVTHYANGTALSHVSAAFGWDFLSYNDKAYCWYNNNSSNADPYGALYTWAAATNGSKSSNNPSGIQGICPTGWHIPSNAEWQELTTTLGNNNVGSILADEKPLWNDGDLENNTDFGTSGFNALPAGSRNNRGDFYGLGYSTNWWSTNEHSLGTSYIWHISSGNTEISDGLRGMENGSSIRCVKD